MRQRQALIWGVVCILGFMASRLLVLEAMPPFIDEAYVLDMGRTMMETSPFYRAEEGRTLAAWYWLGLQAPYQAPFWVARYANVLVAALGLGAALGMARQAGGLPALLTTAALLTFSRFHTFFDSFAGTESLLAGFVLVSVALTHRLRRRVRYTDAALAGAALFVACGMKISALPFVVVPALGVLTLPGVTVRQRVMWGAVAYGSFGALFGGFVGVMMWRGYQPLHHLLRASGGGADLVARTQDIFNAYATYTGAALGGLLLVLAVYLAFRRRFFLLSVLVVPAGVLWLSGGYFTRYLYPHLSVLMVCAAVAAGLTRRRIVPLVLAAVALVGWIPFVWQFVAGDPSELDIPRRDFVEHYAADGSGAGLAEVIGILEAEQPARVIGLLSNCQSLRFMALDTLPVECPRASSTGEDVERLRALLAESRSEGVYAVQENIAYVPEDVPGERIHTVERPGDLTRLAVYDLSP